MSGPNLSRAEKETIVRWSEDPDEPMTVYTHSSKGRDRMKRFGAELKRATTHDGREVAWTFECPREWFKWPAKKRKASPAQIAAGREALQKARSVSPAVRPHVPNEGNPPKTGLDPSPAVLIPETQEEP